MGTLGGTTLKTVVTFVALRLEIGWQMHAVRSKALTNLPKKKQNAVETAIDWLGILI